MRPRRVCCRPSSRRLQVSIFVLGRFSVLSFFRAMLRVPGRSSNAPWRKPRHERLLLLLVALAALTPIYVASSQDVSRLCLARSALAGRLTIGSCAGNALDRARYDGQTYSDKAPGMSLFAVPSVWLTSLPPPLHWNAIRDFRIWLIRLFTGGVAFVLLALAVGRLSEGLSPGRGGLVLVTFALATLVGAMAATTFGHVTAAALGFGAFLLGWRGRYGLAGLLAGLAMVVEYQTLIIVVVLAVYVALKGLRNVAAYAVGVLPGGLLLAGYDRAAFGSPFHLSYRYVANKYAKSQASGFFGISVPHWASVEQVLLSDRGLLVVSPVSVAALVGLVLLGRRHLREALVSAAIVFGFLLLEFGYFLPYGGTSPGPRFLIPALPFLAIGLGPAYSRFPRLTALLASVSLIASTTLQLTWSWSGNLSYRHTVWGELWTTFTAGNERLHLELASNVLTWVGLSLTQAAFFVLGCGGLALVLAGVSGRASAARPSHLLLNHDPVAVPDPATE